jgi:hypothetical protein
MSKPHPKGPRVFRNLFEANTMPRNSQDIRPTHSQDIDLTSFAGRFTPPGAGFALPSGFFSRLNATSPAVLPPSFPTHPGDLPSVNLSTLTIKA